MYHITSHSSTFQNREKSILREQELMQDNPHKNIVKYQGRIDDKDMGIIYFVMELCVMDLKLFRKGRMLASPEVAVIMKQVLTALDYLHRNKIIHR